MLRAEANPHGRSRVIRSTAALSCTFPAVGRWSSASLEVLVPSYAARHGYLVRAGADGNGTAVVVLGDGGGAYRVAVHGPQVPSNALACRQFVNGDGVVVPPDDDNLAASFLTGRDAVISARWGPQAPNTRHRSHSSSQTPAQGSGA